MTEAQIQSGRIRTLETAEDTQSGNGAPGHTAADGTYYWDYTTTELYINSSGVGTFGAVWTHIGGGGVAVPHQLLDNPWHTDTTTNVPVLGDIMTAQAGPSWNRLAHPGVATQFLRANAANPGWAAIAAGDLPNLGGMPALTYGVANAAGAAATYVRTDATIDIFDAVVPGTIQCDDAAAAGVAVAAARRDHQHAIVNAVAVNIGVVNAEGVATSFARSDHVHDHVGGLGVDLHHTEVHVVNSTGPHAEAGLTIGHVLRASGAAAFSFAAIQAGDLPGLGAAPALTFTTANAAGAAATYVQTDAFVAIFDLVVPTTIQADDAAATGLWAFAARRDHVHGFPTVVPVAIGNANAEGTAYDFVRSDHVHNHPAALGVDLHHTEVHVVNSTGPHAEAGLTIGHVLRASGAAAFSFAALIAADLPAHTHAGAATGGSLVVGTTDTDATAGSVFFAGVAGVIQEDNANFFWDDGTNRLGLGTNNPDEMLHLLSSVSAKPAIVIENTNADAQAPVIEFYKNTASPLASDDLGAFDFYGETSTGAKDRYAYWLAESLDVTNGATGGGMAFMTTMNGTDRFLLRLSGFNGAANQGTVTINESGQDVDFYVEAVGVADALFVRGSDGQITLGALGAGFVQSTAGGVLSSAAIIAGDLPAHTHSGAAQGGSLVVGTTDTDATPGSVFFAGVAGVIQEDNANLFWVDGTNRFGIGTVAPDGTFHAHTATAGAFTAAAAADEIVAENSGNAGISIKTPDANTSSLYFGSLSDNDGAHIRWNHDNNLFVVGTANAGAEVSILSAGSAEAIRIDSSQNIGIKESSPSARLDIVEADAVTNATTDVVELTHSTSGTAAANFGAGILYRLEDGVGAGTVRDAMRLSTVWQSAAAAENAEYQLWLNYNQVLYDCGVVVAPGNSTIVGLQRGLGAVDWQGSRSLNTEIASGDWSAIGGGNDGTASGDYSTVPGGNSLVAGGIYSIAVGSHATTDKHGELGHAAGQFAANGDAQRIILVARRQVTHSDANWYNLFLDGAALRMTIPTDTVWTFNARIVGTTQGGGAGIDAFSYIITGCIENDNGTTALKASTADPANVIYRDDADFQAQALADDANDALLIQLTDTTSGGATVRWVAVVGITQVSYP